MGVSNNGPSSFWVPNFQTPPVLREQKIWDGLDPLKRLVELGTTPSGQIFEVWWQINTFRIPKWQLLLMAGAWNIMKHWTCLKNRSTVTAGSTFSGQGLTGKPPIGGITMGNGHFPISRGTFATRGTAPCRRAKLHLMRKRMRGVLGATPKLPRPHRLNNNNNNNNNKALLPGYSRVNMQKDVG